MPYKSQMLLFFLRGTDKL